MANEENWLQPTLSHAEPVLAVNNVSETVMYWHDTLGFPGKWTWGEPPNHGGVSWQGAFIQFSQDPRLASLSKGNSIFIRVRHVEELYHFHQNKNAEIVEPLENKPWGMAGYSVREVNGYFVIFAGAPVTDRKKSTAPLQTVRIVARAPSVKEYLHLSTAVGWSSTGSNVMIDLMLAAPIFAVVAEDEATNEVVGCALLLGDHASFYYLKDLMVHPGWQSKRVGTMLMQELMRWLDSNAPYDAYAALITAEDLVPFYLKFGFTQVIGMHRPVKGNKN